MSWQRNMGHSTSTGLSRGKYFFQSSKGRTQENGKGDTEHYPAITSDDLVKLYSSVLFNQKTPVGLANKVQFDIRLLFCRRGAENIHCMSKSTFKVTQINGSDAVVLSISEASKNHRDDKDAAYGGVMPSRL